MEKKETFAAGDSVLKATGDYTRYGVVCVVFETPDNKTRIVVAHPPNAYLEEKGYVLHIYSPANLQKLPKTY